MKRRRWCAIILTGIFLLFSCRKDSEELKTLQDVVERGLRTAFVVKGEPIPKMALAERMKQYNVPGISIAVINNATIEWAQGYGVVEAGSTTPVTTETIFQAASISKLVSAVLVLSLVQSGTLDLDEDVNRKLQSWKVPENEYTRERKVTLRRVLSHSAGLSVKEFWGYGVDENVPTLLQILDGREPANSPPVRVVARPGSVWQYSGGGYALVQQLLQDVTGKSFSEISQEMIFEKLDMKLSTFAQPLPRSFAATAAIGHQPDGHSLEDKWYTYPEMAAAGLWTTPSDLARLGIEIHQAKAGKSGQVFSTEMTNTLLTPQFGNSGLGAFVNGNGQVTWLFSGGSNVGFRCFMAVFVETGQGAVVMTNSENGSHLAMEIMRGISHFYNWPDFRVQERVVVKVDPKIYGTYEGVYEFAAPPGMQILITQEKKRLVAELVGRKVELYPQTETEYFEIGTGSMISFVKDAEGKVDGLTLTPALASQTWRAKKSPTPPVEEPTGVPLE